MCWPKEAMSYEPSCWVATRQPDEAVGSEKTNTVPVKKPASPQKKYNQGLQEPPLQQQHQKQLQQQLKQSNQQQQQQQQ